MGKGKLNIEKIPRTEKYYHSSSDYGYLRAKSKGFESNKLYSIPSIGGYTSRYWWLGRDKTGVRVVFRPDENGSLSVWELPKENDRYVIGAIGAIDSENKPSIAMVLNVRTLTQVAELTVNLAPDLFAVELLKLSVWYNCALMAVDNSEQRHGLSILIALINGNTQHEALRLGHCGLLYQDHSPDKIKAEVSNKVGFEMSNDRKRLILDNLFSTTIENKLKLNSEKLIKELQIPTIDDGYKTDWANRAYAMAICYEMARLHPYREPRPKEEYPFKGESNI